MTRDEETFEEFFKANRAPLTGQAYLLTGDLAEAHDLAAETLARAWQSWDRLQSYDDPAGWARRVMRNLAIGRWRVARRHRAVIEREGFALMPPVDVQPEPSLAEHAELVAALNTLPMRQRQAIVLRDFCGLPVPEIARELGTKQGTVKSWLSRGHAALAEKLSPADQTQERLDD